VVVVVVFEVLVVVRGGGGAINLLKNHFSPRNTISGAAVVNYHHLPRITHEKKDTATIIIKF